MKRIGEARLLRHLLDQCAGLLQAFGGMIHLEPEQVLIRRLLVITPEQTAQISVVDVALTGNLLQPHFSTAAYRCILQPHIKVA